MVEMETGESHAETGGGRAAPDRHSPILRITASRIVRGCNLHHARSVLRIEVDMGRLAGLTTAAGGRDVPMLFAARFPSQPHSARGYEMDRAFLARLSAPGGAPVEEALLHAIIAVEERILNRMQYLEPITFADATASGGLAVLTWETHAPFMSRRCASVATMGVEEILARAPVSDQHYDAEIEALEQRAVRRRLSGATAVLRLAAHRRGLAPGRVNGQHLHMGEGVHQRYLFSSLTGSSSFGATKLALDKRSSNRRLANLSLPVPVQVGVSDVESALSAVRRIGFPVVIKPSKGNQGRGVTVGIRTFDEVAPAFDYALSCESGVVVEQWLQGVDYRLLVVNGRMVAALTSRPPAVTGDGQRTVRQLVEELNAEPDRDDFRLSPVVFDARVETHLADQGLTLEDVLAPGRRVELLASGHVATGGIPVDVTDHVHPDNQAAAEAAAEAVGLDVAGVDFQSIDIARSYHEVGGGILELNSRPGLTAHLWPRHGRSRDVAGPILDMAFADSPGTVPKLLVAGDRGTGRIARAVDAHLTRRGIVAGLCVKGWTYLGGMPHGRPGRETWHASADLLCDPSLECLVMATSLRRTATDGLGVEHCDGAAILARVHDRDNDAFDRGLEVVIKANRGRFVVASDDPAARRALGAVDPGRLILVAESADDPDLTAHIAAGRTAVTKSWLGGAPSIAVHEQGRVVAFDPVPHQARTDSKELRTLLFAFALARMIEPRGP